MYGTKYNSYEEAFQRETIKNIDLQNKELESRKRLEDSLNVLATFSIIGITVGILFVLLFMFGVISFG